MPLKVQYTQLFLHSMDAAKYSVFLTIRKDRKNKWCMNRVWIGHWFVSN